jgi:hypothetical protein
MDGDFEVTTMRNNHKHYMVSVNVVPEPRMGDKLAQLYDALLFGDLPTSRKPTDKVEDKEPLLSELRELNRVRQ